MRARMEVFTTLPPLWKFRTMDRTSCDVLREKVPTTATIAALGGYYQYEYRRYGQLHPKLRRLHHRQPQHVSACLGAPPCGAAMMMTPSFVWLVTIEALAKTRMRSQRRHNWSTLLSAHSVRAILGLVQVWNYWVNTNISYRIVMPSASPIEWHVSRSEFLNSYNQPRTLAMGRFEIADKSFGFQNYDVARNRISDGVAKWICWGYGIRHEIHIGTCTKVLKTSEILG